MRSEDIVLVVDDDESVRRSIVRLLAASGYVVYGLTPDEDVVQVATDRRATIVILDLQMRAISGLTVARSLRSQNSSRDLWLIALSASLPEADEEVSSIFDRLLAKPCPAEILIQAIEDRASAARQSSIEVRGAH